MLLTLSAYMVVLRFLGDEILLIKHAPVTGWNSLSVAAICNIITLDIFHICHFVDKVVL